MEKEEFNRIFGEFVKVKREQANWTQPDLADRMGNNFQNISRIERGEINPTLHWVTQLAEAFDTSLSNFLAEFEEFNNFKAMKKTKKKMDRAKTMEELVESTKKIKKSLDELEKIYGKKSSKKEFEKNLEKSTTQQSQKSSSKSGQK